MANETTGRADLENCLQSLYPGEIITLIEIDGTKFGANIYRIHNENISYTAEEFFRRKRLHSVARFTARARLEYLESTSQATERLISHN